MKKINRILYFITAVILILSIAKTISNLYRTNDHLIVTVVSGDLIYQEHAANLTALLRSVGKYTGDIAIITDSPIHLKQLLFAKNLTETTILLNGKKLLPRGFQDAPKLCQTNDLSEKRKKAWTSYYLKSLVFHSYFKKWKKVLYVDSLVNIHRPLTPAFFEQIDLKGKILANPDSWPKAEWTLRTQFLEKCNPSLFKELEELRKNSFDTVDYFQSTVMLYDTSILMPSTLIEILQLYQKFGEIADSDQSIFSLYWVVLKQKYSSFPYRLQDTLEVPYDYFRRLADAKYILTSHRDY